MTTNRRITVAEFLVRRGLPADWRFGSPLGRVAADIYREAYRREPSKAFQLINGRFRPVMAYLPSEAHVLTAAWEQYGRTVGRGPAPVARPCHAPADWAGSTDSMSWTPTPGPIRNHP
ncbi:hypothetical protein [Streptomyces canus]|uniref:hypothetical protein n=1 Tax=Streptomyces canus TaxID=58343 RepID=UPI003CF8DC67